ncbi:MAG: LysR family transcriptional regulator [Novosphingobium sp. 17-62-19]|uniref:LysR family transcriptional regulator n=1 Tax=Novosphingobium sp. 17-62-19 TaxID=1970406 RepID=UPI000BD3CA11|nr:LysR family transcriptional regulator [Novosphingobium sp. 17-62-19]OZA21552.1 MAG: LysR family transcriptional regulator [Novosphingobium sp. 17-62-19]HQS95156.1 LysR family transcriptional regulator [Novosphingobium sp.]
MHLRQLRYFVAIARLRHFANAAAECGVSQPTLSAGLSALEQEVGHRLVERDRRFVGLTAQGEAMLPWAEQILGAVASMTSSVAARSAQVTGEFSLAAIPAALPLAGVFGEALLERHPGLTLSVRSATSREIERALNAFECDAGLTYLDHEPPGNVLSVALHAERYLFVTRADGESGALAEVGWEEAARQPLCLLHQGMQFRRILDARMRARGLAITPRVVADSYVTLFDLVRSGGFCTIVPDTYASLLAGLNWAKFVPLDESDEPRRIGLVVVNRVPLSPMAAAALSVGRSLAQV